MDEIVVLVPSHTADQMHPLEAHPPEIPWLTRWDLCASQVDGGGRQLHPRPSLWNGSCWRCPLPWGGFHRLRPPHCLQVFPRATGGRGVHHRRNPIHVCCHATTPSPKNAMRLAWSDPHRRTITAPPFSSLTLARRLSFDYYNVCAAIALRSEGAVLNARKRGPGGDLLPVVNVGHSGGCVLHAISDCLFRPSNDRTGEKPRPHAAYKFPPSLNPSVLPSFHPSLPLSLSPSLAHVLQHRPHRV